MDELINLIVQICYRITFSERLNRRKPFCDYVEQAEVMTVDEAGGLLMLIREDDWRMPVNGTHPAYLLFKGNKNLSVYLLDRDCQFLRRLYTIASPYDQEKTIVIKL